MNAGESWTLATDVNMGGGLSEPCGHKRIGIGAAYMVELAPVLRKIHRLEEIDPGLAAVGHYLYSAMESRALLHLPAASRFTFERFAALSPKWGDGRVWKESKKEELRRLAVVVLIQRRAPHYFSVEKIGALADVKTRKWAQDWSVHWKGLSYIVNGFERSIEDYFAF